MKPLVVITFIVLGGLLSACSKQYTFNTDYNPSTNFGQYKTYSIVDYYKFKADVNPIVNSDINKSRIMTQISKEMNERGFKEVKAQENPDLLVKFRTDVQTRQEFVQTNQNNNWNWYGRRFDPFPVNTTQERIYDEMNLVVDMVETASNKTIWQGWAFQKISKKKENIGERLQEIIASMFLEFPTQNKASD